MDVDSTAPDSLDKESCFEVLGAIASAKNFGVGDAKERKMNSVQFNLSSVVIVGAWKEDCGRGTASSQLDKGASVTTSGSS